MDSQGQALVFHKRAGQFEQSGFQLPGSPRNCRKRSRNVGMKILQAGAIDFQAVVAGVHQPRNADSTGYVIKGAPR